MEEQPANSASCPSQRACSTHRRGSYHDRSPRALPGSSLTASPVRPQGKGPRSDDGVWMSWESTPSHSFAAGAYGYCSCLANGFHHHPQHASRRFAHGGGSVVQDLQPVPNLKTGCYVSYCCRKFHRPSYASSAYLQRGGPGRQKWLGVGQDPWAYVSSWESMASGAVAYQLKPQGRRKDTWVDVGSEEECAGVDGQGMPMAHDDA